MRPHPLWLLLVEDENGKLQDGDFSADQQRPAADATPPRLRSLLAGPVHTDKIAANPAISAALAPICVSATPQLKGE